MRSTGAATQADLKTRIEACWVGKSIGGSLGMPYEGAPGPIEIDLDEADLTPVPNDDLELQLIWLDALEREGFGDVLRTLQRAWLAHQNFHVDEYAVALHNLKRGIAAPVSGVHGNWFEHGMGAAIRSELWACLCPGDPKNAATLAHYDACVDHGREGINAEKLLSAVQSLILGGKKLPDAISEAVEHLPLDSRFVSVAELLLNEPSKRLTEPRIFERLHHQIAHSNFTDCVMNVGYTLWALLAGEGDFDTTLRLALRCGQDTDCTAATAGATLGLLSGMEAIPERHRRRASDAIVVSPHLRSLGLPETLSELTSRVMALADRFEAEKSRFGLSTPEWIEVSPHDDDMSVLAAVLLDLDSEHVIAKAGAICAGEESGVRLTCREWGRGIALREALCERPVADLVVTVGLCIPETFAGWLMIAADAGCNAWLDGRMILDYHGRRPPVPAAHRTEGGGTVPIRLEADRVHRLVVRLLGVRPEGRLYLQLADTDRALVTERCFTV